MELYRILRKSFSDVRLKGIRASSWIEGIEKKRVRQSPYRVYVRAPVVRAMKKVSPGVEEKISFARKKVFKIREAVTTEAVSFDKSLEKFSLEDFYLEEKNPEKAIALLALCQKELSG